MSRREILEQIENPRKLPSYIKLPYPHKLKREDLATLTGSCKAIFQGQLPLKKKDPGSFNSIGKLYIKESQRSLGESTNSIPTWVIIKLEKIQVEPEKPSSNFVKPDTQNKTHLLH
jgi:hypothetical protein